MSGGITPNWPAPSCVGALTTTKDSAELRPKMISIHGESTPIAVQYMRQEHRRRVIKVRNSHPPEAGDALYTDTPGMACAVLSADCLPVLLCSRDGREAAAVHAGWRGLAAGVIIEAVRRFRAGPEEIFAWLGPAISARYYPVGSEVRKAFPSKDWAAFSIAANNETSPGDGKRFYADLGALGSSQLRRAGVGSISHSGLCTWESKQFYSWRRDRCEERHATLIWLRP